MVKINWKNYRVVKFPDRKYALRKGWLFHKYYDTIGGGSFEWRSKSNVFFEDCKTWDYMKVVRMHKSHIETEEVIK